MTESLRLTRIAPPMLFQHLTNIFKMFLIHVHVSKVLLIAVIVPLLKDKMGDTDVVIIIDR